MVLADMVGNHKHLPPLLSPFHQSITFLSVLLNLSVVLGMKDPSTALQSNDNLVCLNMVMNNLVICVLVWGKCYDKW